MNASAYRELLDQLDALHDEVFRYIEISDPRVSLIYRTAAVMTQLRAYIPEENDLPHN